MAGWYYQRQHFEEAGFEKKTLKSLLRKKKIHYSIQLSSSVLPTSQITRLYQPDVLSAAEETSLMQATTSLLHKWNQEKRRESNSGKKGKRNR